MARLTWQIDRALPQAQGVKVLLTFRPESFNVVKHQLNHHSYFHKPDLIPFEGLHREVPAVRLSPFQPEELSVAFELYRKAYDLRTSFPSLPDQLRDSLSHPLTLQVLATIYAGKHIPQEPITEDILIPRLLDRYIEQGRLKNIDIYFIEDNFIPLMFTGDRWRNAVEMIELRRLITEGRTSLDLSALLDALTRLVDAGLLASPNGGSQQPIRFHHESFFEYFAYRFIQRQYALASDAYEYLARIATAPFVSWSCRSYQSIRLNGFCPYCLFCQTFLPRTHLWCGVTNIRKELMISCWNCGEDVIDPQDLLDSRPGSDATWTFLQDNCQY
jgi:hypothetical protein